MYDNRTSAVIREAKRLPGLDMERLPQQLTEAYAKIVSARIAIDSDISDDDFKSILDKIHRLGLTYMSMIFFSSSGQERKSIAFVAGAAFELLIAHQKALRWEGFTSSSLCTTCAASLLFMIGDSPSDAAEIARNLHIDANDNSLQGLLRNAVRCIAP